MIIVLDPVEAEAKLRRGDLPCRHCGRRVRCRPCAVSEVLLPSQILPRCAASSELVGQVLLAAVRGHGHRRIAADLGLPADSVRRWLRRARANAIWLSKSGAVRAYQLDANLPPIRSAGSVLGDAVEALGQAAGAFVRMFGPNRSPRAVIAVLARRAATGRPCPAPARLRPVWGRLCIARKPATP